MELAEETRPEGGEFRVFNQPTGSLSVCGLAETVEESLLTAIANRERILLEVFAPWVNWRNPSYE